VAIDPKIDPPIHVKNYLSAGPMTLTLTLDGTNPESSFINL